MCRYLRDQGHAAERTDQGPEGQYYVSQRSSCTIPIPQEPGHWPGQQMQPGCWNPRVDETVDVHMPCPHIGQGHLSMRSMRSLRHDAKNASRGVVRRPVVAKRMVKCKYVLARYTPRLPLTESLKKVRKLGSESSRSLEELVMKTSSCPRCSPFTISAFCAGLAVSSLSQVSPRTKLGLCCRRAFFNVAVGCGSLLAGGESLPTIHGVCIW